MNEPTVNRKDWIERWQSIEAQSRKAITQHMSQVTDESAFVSTLIQNSLKMMHYL